MIAACIVALGLVAGQPAESTPPPTLDQAVLIESSVDRNVVWLGEAVTLTLEHWEMDFRGVRIQPFYRNPGPEMPAAEGFFAGPVTVVRDNRARDGVLYKLTVSRQRLFPAVAGNLEIAPWRWKGTASGYLASGSVSRDLDLATAPIAITVKPLPDPPSTFRGAVGEYSLTATLSSTELTLGSPATLTLTVAGNGNAEALEPPQIPEGAWYTLRPPVERPGPVTGAADGGFTTAFEFELVPIEPGEFNLPAISLTYFSPRAGAYQSSRTAPVAVRVVAVGPQAPMVVIGGAASSPDAPAIGADGRLLLEEPPESLSAGIPAAFPVPPLLLAPPLVALALWLITAARRGTFSRVSRGGDRGRRAAIERALGAGDPATALAAVLREALAGRGIRADGLSGEELRELLEPRIGAPRALALAEAVLGCQRARYGGGAFTPPNPAALVDAILALTDSRGEAAP